MRMAFGLVSLLVTVAIILWMMVGGGPGGGPGYLQTVSKTNKQLKAQVNVMAGKDPSGQILATDSIHTKVDRTGGRPKLIISEVMPGGPMDVHYGVMPNDRVVEIGGLDFEQNIGTRDAANDWFATAYARNQPIVVVRDGKTLTLPTAEHIALIAEAEKQAALAAAAANGSTVATPTAPEDDRNAIQSALDSLRSPAK